MQYMSVVGFSPYFNAAATFTRFFPKNF